MPITLSTANNLVDGDLVVRQQIGEFSEIAEPYLLDVSTVSQLSDSQTGALLAGGINKLQDSETKKVAEPITAEYLQKMVDKETKLGAVSLAKAMSPKP